MRIFKVTFNYQFLRFLYDSRCKNHLLDQINSKIKNNICARISARATVSWKSGKSQNITFFSDFWAQLSKFLCAQRARKCARAINFVKNQFSEKCRWLLHLDSIYYLKNSLLNLKKRLTGRIWHIRPVMGRLVWLRPGKHGEISPDISRKQYVKEFRNLDMFASV